jgi:hypothetical protein
VRNPQRKGPLEKRGHRWEGNIKIDFGEIRWEGVDWIDLAQKRGKLRTVVKAEIKFMVPQNEGKFLNS